MPQCVTLPLHSKPLEISCFTQLPYKTIINAKRNHVNFN
jgi:hypothetical protein